MLLIILLLSLVLCSLTNSGASAKSSPKQCLEGSLENLVEKLESRLRDMEIRLEETETRLESKDKEMKMRLEQNNQETAKQLEELEDKAKEEMENKEKQFEASISKLRIELEESLRKEIASRYSNNSLLINPTLRDLPIVLISAWQPSIITSPQTVTFDSFLANYNNGDRPGGGDGVFDLDAGIFTCITPGFYTVSFSAHGAAGGKYANGQFLFLYKNGSELPQSKWYILNGSSIDGHIGVTSSRILVSNLLEMFARCKITVTCRFSKWMRETLWSSELRTATTSAKSLSTLSSLA